MLVPSPWRQNQGLRDPPRTPGSEHLSGRSLLNLCSVPTPLSLAPTPLSLATSWRGDCLPVRPPLGCGPGGRTQAVLLTAGSPVPTGAGEAFV